MKACDIKNIKFVKLLLKYNVNIDLANNVSII